MREGELFGVQKMATKVTHVRAQPRVLNCVVTTGAVGFITDNRMFEPRQMNANLVRPAGL